MSASHTKSRARRQELRDQVKLILTTAALSVLIWAYAARLDLGEEVRLVQFEIVPPADGDLVATMVHPARAQATVRLRGSNAALRELRTVHGADQLRFDWHIPVGTPPGELKQSVRALFERQRGLHGLAVTETEPESFVARIDRYIRVELPIRLQIGSYTVVGEALATPRTTSVRVLESAWEKVPLDQRHVPVVLDDYLRDKPEGVELSFEASLTNQIAGAAISADPPKINVKLTLRGQTREVTLAPVVIKLAIAEDLLRTYRPELRDPAGWRTQIVVQGPPDVIGRLRPNEVLGIIDVTSADVSVDGTYRTRRPVFLLPPGVQLKGDAPEVDLRLVAEE